ncbi:MAG: hypothetical protein WCQ53_02710 [bacterium]
MTSSNNRKLISKYQIGNLLFQLLCAGFGALAFLYLSFTVQFFYEITPLKGTYYLFLTGSFLFIWGMVFLLFKRVRKLVSFPVFVYTGLGLFFVLYVGSIFIHAYPQMALYLFIPIYLALGLLLFMFLSLWKREGGVSVFLYFFIGVVLSGPLNRMYSGEPLYIIYAVRIVFLIFCVFIGSYAVGFFGMFKERRYSFIIATVIAFVAIMYPLNFGVLLDQLERFRWQNTAEKLGPGYDYVDSYQTLTRKIDVFLSNNDSKESFSFVENGTPIVYTYPLNEDHELSFYYSLTQQKEPMKSILVVGDIPVGLTSVLNKLPNNIEIHYMPVDKLYPAFWSNFIHDQMFEKIKIINKNSELLSDYNIVYLFPPNIKGAGSFSYINKKQFEFMRKHITVGSLIVVTSRLFPVGVESVIRNNIDGMFRNVSYLKTTNDINFIIASDDPGNVTSDPSTLKYRFLEIGVEGDYSRIKTYFENNRAVVSNYFGAMDSASFDKSSINKDFLIWSSVAGFVLFLVMYFSLNLRTFSVNTWVHSINTIIMFTILGEIFSTIVLYHQRMFVDLHTSFSSMFSMFFLGLTTGIVVGWFICRKAQMDRMFLWGMGTLFILVLSWTLFMNYISDSRILVFYLVWAGLSSILILGTIYWYRFFISLDNMFRLLSLIFLGLGFGIISAGVFDYYNIRLMMVNYAISVWALLFLMYNMTVLKEKKL